MSASLQKSLSTRTTKFDKSVDQFVRNDTNVNILRVALIAYAVFIDSVPNEVIQLFDIFAIRLLVTLSVAYLLFKDVITALLLALCFILTIQELKKRLSVPYRINNTSVSVNSPSPNPMMTGGSILRPSLSFGNESGNNPEDSPDPAFKTMTQNLVEGSAFTTDEDLRKASSNMVQGADPDEGVKTFVNQHGTQGLDVPLGFDKESSISSKF